MTRRLLVAGAALVVAVVAGGVLVLTNARNHDGAMLAPVVPRGEIAVAYPDEPPSLNPYLYEGETNATRDLLRPVFPTLLSIGPDLRYRPALATRVPSGRDLTEQPFSVTFRLDRKALWSDGIPVTANDVRFTWETVRRRDLPIADRSPYLRVTDVAVLDPHTVRLVFDRGYPAWRDLFSAGGFLMPKHALEGKEFSRGWEQLPGAGPFVIEKYEPGFRVVYAANPRWWRRGPGLERVTVFIVPNIDTALRLLGENRVQVIVSTTQLNLTRRIERLSGMKVASRFGAAWWELAFNNQQPGPKPPPFRKAVASGFDDRGIVEGLIRSEGRLLENLAPGRRAAPAFSPYRFDQETSRKALREAGFGESRGKFVKADVGTIGISTPEESEIGLIVERSIYQGLVNTGFDVELRNPRGSLLYGDWRREGKFDLALWERRGTPLQPFVPLFRSTSSPPEGINYYRLSSSEVDKAVDAVEESPAFDSRAVDELMRQLAESLPAIPVFEAKAFVGFRSSVRGPDPNATIDGPFWNLEEWRLGPSL